MFKEKLALVPSLPGCYQMKNKDGVIIYVGKAKNLKNRLRSYFTGTVTGKTLMLVNDIADFEYIVTSSELESLILEINLIKKYNPKYNILLKDDKSYPYIELTNEKYPILKVVRYVNRKKNRTNLFGPYPSVGNARSTVDLLNRIYPLRKCERLKKDVCLYYHIGECLGYCRHDVPESKIKDLVKEITTFLNGDSKGLLDKLHEEMIHASDNLNFERAKEIKDLIDSINITLRPQYIDLNKNYNFDIFGFYKRNNYLSIQVFFIRNGLLFGRHKDIIQVVDEDNETLLEYIIKFYDKNNVLPKEILVSNNIDSSLLTEYLKIKVSTPKKGKLKKLLDMVEENAKIELENQESILNNNEQERIKAINYLKEILKMDKLNRIEAFDNSHLFGTFYVGGMVVFEDFLPLKSEYRKYKIAVDVKDDISAMKEVIYRRYFKVMMENLTKPDLIIVDGGKAQVNVAKEIIDSLKLNIKVIGLKKDDKHNTDTIIDDNLEEIRIDNHSNLFLFLAKIQKEVHEYTINYHRNLKNKGAFSSILDIVPGIGEVRKKELLKRYSSLKKMKEATLPELEEILNKDVALSLFNYLKEL